MRKDERRVTGPIRVISHRNLYLLNGQILKFAIETWVGLMVGFCIAGWFAPGGLPTEMQILEIKIIVFSMIGVAILGGVPWLKDPKGTWRLATSEPGDLQGICNRCAAFLPVVGLIVLLVAIVLWMRGIE